MPRGPRVPIVVKRFIGEVAVLNPEWTPSELRVHVADHLEGQDLYVPGPDSFRKIAREVRKLGPEDVPWSIGVSLLVIPSDAIPDVLSVWRWTVIKGYAFTVRQAKWVAQLRGVVRGGVKLPFEIESEGFYVWAERYAARERASEALQLSLETSDLDGKLPFQEDVRPALLEKAIARVNGEVLWPTLSKEPQTHS